jgi:phenylalanine ammonia-lyase
LLQKSILQLQNVGILVNRDGREVQTKPRFANTESQEMPIPWVKAMMLIRCNSLLRGHSGVRLCVLEAILGLLANDCTPVVPLRGSISASGDLMPLSYLASALEGNPDVYVRRLHSGSKQLSEQFISSSKVLELINLSPITFGPKEALGLMNGTSVSCAVASVAVYQAQHHTFLAQIATAMATEALLGSRDNHDPFISQIRPHDGQKEAAAAMYQFLKGSRLATDRGQGGPFSQDRYTLRTVSQWIGPQLEDIALARHQVGVELNSTTDNPLIDVSRNLIHNGGNFQAAALTSAMSKIQHTLQIIGRLIFAQCSELLNSMLTKGLPPNLAFDSPNRSFTFKGIDVSMAAYMSELTLLAVSPVAGIQSAEMHNQAINSLALLAARRAIDASNLLYHMEACFLYSLCQALDLRCLHLDFITAAEPVISSLLMNSLKSSYENFESSDLLQISNQFWSITVESWLKFASLDDEDRATATADAVVGALMTWIRKSDIIPAAEKANVYAEIQGTYTFSCAKILAETYSKTKNDFALNPSTVKYLGEASRVLYLYIRDDLGVPLQQGLKDHPTVQDKGAEPPKNKYIMGTWISKIYQALYNGESHKPIMKVAELYLKSVDDYVES